MSPIVDKKCIQYKSDIRPLFDTGTCGLKRSGKGVLSS